ncbi:hypothetical protein [Halocatena salina]|uniref:Uncharacterized protein n=1 Tax=Halocatena salina TaxID=2934340 RepID=A0A8U0A3K8_9EURY|nr:hypothetical protein [Halocatena salina]UPM43436.1 hypothetical protein MW046_03070 [Halocatena salina]
MNAVVVDGALELSWERDPATRGPDIHDVLAGRASPIEAVCQDGPVAILPCGRSIDKTPEVELAEVLHAVEHEYNTVLIDWPRTMHNVSSTSQGVVLVWTSAVFDRNEACGPDVMLDTVVAIALLGADRTTEAAFKRFEQQFRAL